MEGVLTINPQGSVEKRAVDGCNLPVYFPAEEEMRRAVEKNGCFSIERTELTDPFSKVKRPIDVDAVVRNLRSTNEGVLTAHFGKSAVEKIFTKMFAKGREISDSLEACCSLPTQMLLVLKRK